MPNPITGGPANYQRGLISMHPQTLQPRFGVAYQITPKTVLRGSYAIFYDLFGGNYAQTQQGNRGNWPYAFPQSVAGLNTGIPQYYLENPFPGPAAGSTTPLGCQQCLEVADANTKIPMIQEWSLSVQRQLTPSTKVELDYFGSHAVHLGGQITDNTAMTPGTDSYHNRQLWPQFPPYTDNGFEQFPAFYDGVDVSITKELSRNLVFLTSYSYSKTLDFVDSLGSYSPGITPTRFDIPSFRGPASFDTRQRFVASYIYEIPVHTRNRFLSGVASGWQHSGILSIDSGIPYVVFLSSDNENIGGSGSNEFPNLVCDPTKGFSRTAKEFFNVSCFTTPTYGTIGNAGKHPLFGEAMVNWDADVTKKFKFKETKDVEFRAQFFNFPNASTYGVPQQTLGVANFGVVSSTRQGGRQIQFALKLHF
jgi:hypothetical protein